MTRHRVESHLGMRCKSSRDEITHVNGALEYFEERGKPEYPEKNLSEQGREPTTNSTHTPSPGLEPGPHWWEASTLTTTPSLFPSSHFSSSIKPCKHLMTGPKGNSKFCFPWTLIVPRGEGSRSPVGLVIKCFVIPHNSKIEQIINVASMTAKKLFA